MIRDPGFGNLTDNFADAPYAYGGYRDDPTTTGPNIEYYKSMDTTGTHTGGTLESYTFRVDMDGDGDWDRWGVNDVSLQQPENTWTESLTYFDREGDWFRGQMHYGAVEGVDMFEGQDLESGPRVQQWME